MQRLLGRNIDIMFFAIHGRAVVSLEGETVEIYSFTRDCPPVDLKSPPDRHLAWLRHFDVMCTDCGQLRAQFGCAALCLVEGDVQRRFERQ